MRVALGSGERTPLAKPLEVGDVQIANEYYFVWSLKEAVSEAGILVYNSWSTFFPVVFLC